MGDQRTSLKALIVHWGLARDEETANRLLLIFIAIMAAGSVFLWVHGFGNSGAGPAPRFQDLPLEERNQLNSILPHPIPQ